MSVITFPERRIEHNLTVPTPGASPYTLDDMKTWVQEAQEIHAIWRPHSWYSEECVDGVQWTEDDAKKARDAGVDPLVINKQFRTIQTLIGLQINNKFDTIVKGRTQDDTEMAGTMTEGVKYVYDQPENGVDYKVSKAWKDQIVPGIGWLMICHNDDPREEIIRIAYRDWKEMWWDPFADPWLDPRKTRYAFHMPYVDLSVLMDQWPEKAEELKNYAAQQSSYTRSNNTSIWYDEAQEVEDYKTLWGRSNLTRTRVRPVEMYYPVRQKGLWAIFENGDARPLPDMEKFPREAVEMIKAAERVGMYNVRRMWSTTFLDDILLASGPTPFNHDQFPYIPFVGYVDRFGFPYGVPHQTKGQMMEINKRRSMLLALLQKQRAIVESGIVGDKGGAKELESIHNELNKLDGFAIVAPGTIEKIKITEGIERGMLQAQAMILQLSENEFREVNGVNAEQEGMKSQALSGVAQEKRKEASSIGNASLFENLRQSKWRMAGQIVSEIQGQWKGQKVLRVTDRATSAERYVKLNEKVFNQKTGAYEIRNNVTQGRYDYVIAEAPATDTQREMNGMLIMEAIKKSPPDSPAIPELLTLYMELSATPNKDMLVAKLRSIYHLDPGDENMSPEEAKARTMQALAEHQKQMQEEAQYQGAVKQLTLQNLDLENKLLMAQIQDIMNGGVVDQGKLGVMRKELQISHAKLALANKDLELKGFKIGADVGDRKEGRNMERMQAAMSRADEKEAGKGEGE